MSLIIECQEKENDVVVIDVEGEINFENAEILREKINELCEKNKTKIVINLQNLKYMSSAGMSVLVHGLKRTRQKNGDLRIAHLNSKMRRVFLITQFTHHFSVFNTTEEAVKSFNEDQKEGQLFQLKS